MSKQFIVDRHTTPGTPALAPVAIPKVPVYDTMADVTADLANLSDGQIVATKDTGTELSQPVDVVEEGNLHAVTSNAVAKSINSKDITSSVTINTNYCNVLKVIQAGNIIDVVFETKAVSEINAILATGLPKPKSVSREYGLQVFGSTGSISYCGIENNGVLFGQCNSASTAIGHVTYICE